MVVNALGAAPLATASPLVAGVLIGVRLAAGTALALTVIAALLPGPHRRGGLRRLAGGIGAGAAGGVAVTLAVQRAPVNEATSAAVVAVSALLSALALLAVLAFPRARTGPPLILVGLVVTARAAVAAARDLGGYAGQGAPEPLAGVALGIAVAAATGLLGYGVARRGPRRAAEMAAGTLGVLVAAGAASAGVGGLQHSGHFPGATHRAVDTLGWAGWWSPPGATLRAVFGLTPTPTVAQAVIWATTVAAATAVAVWRWRSARPNATAPR